MPEVPYRDAAQQETDLSAPSRLMRCETRRDEAAVLLCHQNPAGGSIPSLSHATASARWHLTSLFAALSKMAGGLCDDRPLQSGHRPGDGFRDMESALPAAALTGRKTCR